MACLKPPQFLQENSFPDFEVLFGPIYNLGLKLHAFLKQKVQKLELPIKSKKIMQSIIAMKLTFFGHTLHLFNKAA